MRYAENDYSNLRFSMADMERYFKDGNVRVSDNDRKSLNLIFNNFDKFDEKGNKIKKGDGFLNMQERTKFLEKIKDDLPDLYNEIVDFAVTVEVIEDLRKTQEETLTEFKQQQTYDDIKNSTFDVKG